MAARRRRGRGLGICLILPLPGVTLGAQVERIGGNYTNVTWDIGACIAADGTLHLVSQAASAGRLRGTVAVPRARPTASCITPAAALAAPRPPRQDHPPCHPAPIPGVQDRPGPGTETALADVKFCGAGRAVPAGWRAGWPPGPARPVNAAGCLAANEPKARKHRSASCGRLPAARRS